MEAIVEQVNEERLLKKQRDNKTCLFDWLLSNGI